MSNIIIGAGITLGGGVGLGSGGGGGGGGSSGYPLQWSGYNGSADFPSTFQSTPKPDGTVITTATFQTLYKTTYLQGWDPSSVTGNTSVDVSSVLGSYKIADGCGQWNADGTTLEVLVYTGGGMSPATGRFGKLQCATPYDVSTINAFNTSSNTLYTNSSMTPRGLLFGNSGSKVYYIQQGILSQHTLSTPYDTFSVSGSGTTVDLYTDFGLPDYPFSLALTSNGLVALMMIAGGLGDGVVIQFTLNTPWDFSTLNLSPTSIVRPVTIGGDLTSAGGMILRPTNNLLLVSGFNPSFVSKMYSYNLTPTP